MTTQVEIRSETLYDALIDGWSLVRRVLATPSTPDELARAEGLDVAVVQRRLAPILRAGILRQEGEHLRAAGNAVHTVRLEGMISSLSRYVLPLITNLVRNPDGGILLQLDLVLSDGEQAALRGGLVQTFLEELNAISDEDATERQTYTAVLVGTSDVPPAGQPDERYLETVRRCARQRSIADQATRAVLTFGEGLFGTEHAEYAAKAIRSLAERLEPHLAGARKPNYTMILALGARSEEQGVKS